jgi:hypothetical protein
MSTSTERLAVFFLLGVPAGDYTSHATDVPAMRSHFIVDSHVLLDQQYGEDG